MEARTNVVRILLRTEGVDVNEPSSHNESANNYGRTPLFTACAGGHVEVVKLLMGCNSIEVNQRNTADGATALHPAAALGHLSVAQLVVAFGADTTAVDTDYNQTAQELAVRFDHPELAAWLGAVAQWSSLRVAAGCRFHSAVAIQLKQGRMDPDKQLLWPEMQLALDTSVAPPANLPWDDAPEVCPITAKLITDAIKGWAPKRHWLHHANIRTAVHILLLVSERLHCQHLQVTSPPSFRIVQQQWWGGRDPAGAVVPILPPEMWSGVARFFVRSDWPVTPALPSP
jgi:hypothetical protein